MRLFFTQARGHHFQPYRGPVFKTRADSCPCGMLRPPPFFSSRPQGTSFSPVMGTYKSRGQILPLRYVRTANSLSNGPSNCWPPQTGGCGPGVQGGCATYHQGLKTGCVPGLGGGGGCSAYYGINRGEGGIKGGNGRRCGGGGGGGMMGQRPWRHPRGGGGAKPWRHPRGGGGWDKHPGATPLPHPDEECESCRQGGGRLGTTIKGKQVGGIAKRCEQR